ncbi:MAG: hypothetical protein PHP98_07950 [Kiritimatiellae bacterium]|nr:hypothetical protein [Kiritimatiellia bacterium]
MTHIKKLAYVIAGVFFVFAGPGITEVVRVFPLAHPVTNKRILPDTDLLLFSSSVSEIMVLACPGEYEPASFVLRTEEDMEGVTAEAAELEGKENAMAPGNVDIRVVKCWWQDKGIGYREETPARLYNPTSYSAVKTLIPELLLHDDSLVKVDKENNYLKLVFEKGSPAQREEYVLASREGGIDLPREKLDRYINYIYDSPTLVPFNLKRKENKQLWLTIKIPDNAAPGVYKGEVRIKKGQAVLGAIPMKVRVLPIKLLPPYHVSSIYYYMPSGVTYQERQFRQFRKETENLLAHGVFNPVFPTELVVRDPGLKDMEEALKIREELGIRGQPLFICGNAQNLGFSTSENSAVTPSQLEELKKKTRDILAMAGKFNIPEVYFYGVDEAKGDRLAAQRPLWEAIHQAGGKVFAAGYISEGEQRGNFEFAGDIQNLLNCAGYPSRQEAAKWHSAGHKITCYANPQGGAEVPETYRRNFGVLLWQYDYDGAMTWLYQCGHYHENKGALNTWNDFTPLVCYKAANMVYPAADGVIDTLEWEGYREGVDDARYLAALVAAAKEARESKDPKMKDAAGRANGFLAELKQGDINRDVEDMDLLRLKMIDLILKLKGEDNEQENN